MSGGVECLISYHGSFLVGFLNYGRLCWPCPQKGIWCHLVYSYELIRDSWRWAFSDVSVFKLYPYAAGLRFGLIIICSHTGEEWPSQDPVWPHQQCIAQLVFHFFIIPKSSSTLCYSMQWLCWIRLSICHHFFSFLTQRVCPLENLVQILFLHFGQRSYVVTSLHKHMVIIKWERGNWSRKRKELT